MVGIIGKPTDERLPHLVTCPPIPSRLVAAESLHNVDTDATYILFLYIM